MTLLRVEAPHFTAGLVIEQGICTETAPILAWAQGKRMEDLLWYFHRKHYRVVVVSDRLWT